MPPPPEMPPLPDCPPERLATLVAALEGLEVVPLWERTPDFLGLWINQGAGAEILGHEFHYARVLGVGDDRLVDCRDAADEVVAEAGARRGSVSGTFFHAISRGLS